MIKVENNPRLILMFLPLFLAGLFANIVKLIWLLFTGMFLVVFDAVNICRNLYVTIPDVCNTYKKIKIEDKHSRKNNSLVPQQIHKQSKQYKIKNFII